MVYVIFHKYIVVFKYIGNIRDYVKINNVGLIYYILVVHLVTEIYQQCNALWEYKRCSRLHVTGISCLPNI